MSTPADQARAELEKLVDGAAIEIYGVAYRGDREDRLTGQRFPEPGWCWERCGDVAQAFARKQARAALLSPLVLSSWTRLVERVEKMGAIRS